jgi:hypothetical protein
MRPIGNSLFCVAGTLVGCRSFFRVKDVDRNAPFGGRAHDGAQRLGYAAAPADYFSQILGIDDKLDDRLALFVGKQFNARLIRFCNKPLCEQIEQRGRATQRGPRIGRLPVALLATRLIVTTAAATPRRALGARRSSIFGLDIIDDRFV